MYLENTSYELKVNWKENKLEKLCIENCIGCCLRVKRKNGAWNARIFWQLGVSSNHLGFLFYESPSKFCFICWIVNPGKSNFWHMWDMILGHLKFFCLEWAMLHILNMSLSPVVLTFQGRMSDQIRKIGLSFSFCNHFLKQNAV